MAVVAVRPRGAVHLRGVRGRPRRRVVEAGWKGQRWYRPFAMAIAYAAVATLWWWGDSFHRHAHAWVARELGSVIQGLKECVSFYHISDVGVLLIISPREHTRPRLTAGAWCVL